MTLRDEALAMVGRGWHIFPCEPRGKRPAGALAPHGLNDATDDLDQVRDWWTREPDANIGLATGRRSGVIVIDLDGEEAEDNYGRLLLAHGSPGAEWCTDGATVRTGSGWHLYFAPPDVEVRNSASKIGKGIDVRGDGGYVVAPPSIHPSGRVYVWRDEVPERGLPTLAPKWVDLVTPPPPPPRLAMPAPTGFDGGSTPYGNKALENILSELAAAPVGTRNDSLNRTVYRLVQLADAGHLDLDKAIGVARLVASEIGLSDDEIDGTIESAVRGARRAA